MPIVTIQVPGIQGPPGPPGLMDPAYIAAHDQVLTAEIEVVTVQAQIESLAAQVTTDRAAVATDRAAVATDRTAVAVARSEAFAAAATAAATDAGVLRADLTAETSLRSSSGDVVAMSGGLWPLMRTQDSIVVGVDGRGILRVADVARHGEEPAVITGGVVPIVRDDAGQPLVWWDAWSTSIRSAGDMHDRDERVKGPLAVVAGLDAVLQLGADGEIYAPASAVAPIVYARQVDDGGGARSQIYMADGQREWRLTAASVDCHAPALIAPGIVRYARSDGLVSSVRAPRDPTAAGSTWIGWIYGQSLALGSNSYANFEPGVIETAPEPRVQMFNSGIRVGLSPTTPISPADIDHLVPAREQYSASGDVGETGAAAFGFGMTRETQGSVIVGATAKGGAAYAIIKKGTIFWASMMTAIARAVELSPGATVVSLDWRHGESEEGATPAEYLAIIDEAYADYCTDVMAITGQTVPPVMILQQIQRMEASGLSGTPADWRLEGPGRAAGDAGLRGNATTILASPQYPCEFGDVYHMRPWSYDWMASQKAKSLRRNSRPGGWMPLHMTSATRVGNVVDVTFGGGWVDDGGRICLDTSWVSDPGNYGVVYYDAAGSAVIRHVSILDRTTLRIRLSAVPTDAGTIGIAFFAAAENDQQGRLTGLRSCIRDNDPEGCPVTGRPLHNYAVSQVIGVN